jgi:drug/metabolite transporter (DMT)-like permease
MQTLKQKLSSRKFWVALATIVSGVLMMFGYAETDIQAVSGAVLTIGGAIGYMVSEAVVDAAKKKEGE